MNDSPATAAPHGVFVRQGLSLALAVVVVDQVSKWIVLDLFSANPQAVAVLPVFNLVLVWNQGISFGLFGNASPWGSWILIALAVGISLFLARWMARAENRLTALGLAAIIGGAVGNVIDRVRFGAVVDFLDVHVWGYHWPAFNVADTAISIGAAVLILESLFYGSKKP